MNIETDFEAMSFGQVLQYYRMDRKLSVTKLAAATHISKGAVSMLERGLRVPQFITVRKLATGLRLTPEEDTKLAFKASTAMWLKKRPGQTVDPAKQDEANRKMVGSILPFAIPGLSGVPI